MRQDLDSQTARIILNEYQGALVSFKKRIKSEIKYSQTPEQNTQDLKCISNLIKAFNNIINNDKTITKINEDDQRGYTPFEILKFYLSGDIFLNLNIYYNVIYESNTYMYTRFLNFQFIVLFDSKLPLRDDELIIELIRVINPDLDLYDFDPIRKFAYEYLAKGLEKAPVQILDRRSNKLYIANRDNFIKAITEHINNEIKSLEDESNYAENNDYIKLNNLRIFSSTNLQDLSYKEIINFNNRVFDVAKVNFDDDINMISPSYIKVLPSFIAMVSSHANINQSR